MEKKARMTAREEVIHEMQWYAGKSIKCGTPEDAPTAERIRETEELLGVPLPESYKWFFSRYGYAEIGGCEVWSIYPEYEEDVYSGDIAFQYKDELKSGFVTAQEIPLAVTPQGEWFVFDITEKAEGNEYPVNLIQGGERLPLAENFLDFIIGFIGLQCYI